MSASKVEITQELLDNFCAVTGSDAERAKFFLEASNGDINSAIESFFENGGAESATPSSSSSAAPITGAGASGLARDKAILEAYNSNDEEEEEKEGGNSRAEQMLKEFAEQAAKHQQQMQQKKKAKKDKKPKAEGNSRIFTLNSINNNEDDDEDVDDDDDEDDHSEAFFAGGSSTSGQQILGPPGQKKKTNPDHLIKDLFQKAKEHGAQEVSGGDDSAGARASDQKPSTSSGRQFGTGYRLGTGEEPSEVIKGPDRPKPPKSNVLKLWKNGFNVDDGPLRAYDDPKNKEFLQSIEKGEPPRELLRAANNAEVHLDMQDHREEDFVAPKEKYVLYDTEGHKLGSPTPQVVSNASANDLETNEKQARDELRLDTAQPTTQIQVRLSNGTRIIIKANQLHKVSDLRSYIIRARPEYNGRSFALLTSFPNREIENEGETLAEAKLLNAVIIQKLK